MADEIVKQCVIEGCEKRMFSGGLCSAHYARRQKYGDPLKGGPARHAFGTVRCNVCEAPAQSKGMCRKHYRQAFEYPNRKYSYVKKCKPIVKCLVPECDRMAETKDLCNRCYQQFRRTGLLKRGAVRRRVIGEKKYTPQGYIEVFDPGHPLANKRTKTVLEHRAAMSSALGRPLREGEEVHHVNGNRADNRPENLEIWVIKQPAGQRPEDLATYAREILRLYGTESEQYTYSQDVLAPALGGGISPPHHLKGN